jgi:hypothetical protein
MPARRRAQVERGVGLRIEIDQTDAAAVPREGDGEVDGGRRLADSSFLVRDGDRAHGGRSSRREAGG